LEKTQTGTKHMIVHHHSFYMIVAFPLKLLLRAPLLFPRIQRAEESSDEDVGQFQLWAQALMQVT